jgi:hypothetical protein
MVKAKVCVVVLLCAAACLLVTSCANVKYPLQVELPESGHYQIDVADWFQFTPPGAEEPEWAYSVADAVTEAEARYVETGNGLPTYPIEYTAHLTDYTITWQPAATGVTLPRITGVLDVLVPYDQPATFDFMVISAGSLDTCAALTALRGDPESGEFFNGDLSARAKVVFKGADVLTGEEVEWEAKLNVVFADYQD